MGSRANVHLKKGSLRRYLNWLGRERLVCECCGEELHPGDEIRRVGKVLWRKNPWDLQVLGNKNCRFYHRSCHNSLYLEL